MSSSPTSGRNSLPANLFVEDRENMTNIVSAPSECPREPDRGGADRWLLLLN